MATSKIQSPLMLVPAGPSTFVGATGSTVTGVCEVFVHDEGSVRGVAGAEVRYEVIEGPVELAQGKRVSIARTSKDGYASVDVHFTGRGAAVITAELPRRGRIVGFGGRSEGVAHEIAVVAPAAFSTSDGGFDVRIVVLDHLGAPVEGADLVLQATQEPDLTIAGTVREIGGGVYQGGLETLRAGEWTILAQDRTTHAYAHRCIHGLPGNASEILVIGNLDPRAAAPWDRLELRVQLVDENHNRLDPSRLQAEGPGGPLPRRLEAEDALFLVQSAASGIVETRIRDTGSDIVRQQPLLFSSATLVDPGWVGVGSRFHTAVRAFSSEGKAIAHGTIAIRFDPRRTSFVGVHPAAGFQVEARRKGDTVTLDVTKTRGRGSDGPVVAEIEWKCSRAGASCFAVSGQFSPATEGWKLCVQQKHDRSKSMCVNIIYPPGDTAARAAGFAAATQLYTVISSKANVKRCCPVLNYVRHTKEIPRESWKKILKNDVLGPDGQVTSSDEFNHLVDQDLGHCKRPHCLNVWMISHNDPGAGGRTQRLGEGNIALDPELARTRPNVMAHEFGHALGLPDAYERNPDGSIVDKIPGNLMSYPHGENLTEEQCKEIWKHIDAFGE